MFFTEDFTLSTLICDQDDVLTLWGLARLFQDIADNHSSSLGVGYEDLKPQHKAWVLTHVYYSVLRLPLAGERLTLKTWAKPDNGLIAPRDYQLFDSEGNVCASCTSNWVILDMDKRRVCRLGSVLGRFEYENDDATPYSRLDKIKMPTNMQRLKHLDVPYSSLDHTRHVNNAEYIKWICDSIPEICTSRSISNNTDRNTIGVNRRPEITEFSINYLKETKYGDQDVELFFFKQDNNNFFQLINNNGISVNAVAII